MITAYCSIKVSHPNPTPALAISASNITQAFINDCHRYYIGYYFAVKGCHSEIDNLLSRALQSGSTLDNMLSLGTQPPDQEQSPGRSTTAQIRFADLSQSNNDGIYEDFIAKALLVFIYHSWRENCKERLAISLSISKDDIEWELMDEDIRLVRNKIIHEDSTISIEILNRLAILPRMWNIQSGQLMVSERMISSLFEQVNATKIVLSP